jgi:ABC-type multidrug transport system fused ATPase/permease subunit
MAFAGNCGINIQISEQWKSKTQLKDKENESVDAYFPILFGEELGFILEVLDTDIELVKVSIIIINIAIMTNSITVIIIIIIMTIIINTIIINTIIIIIICIILSITIYHSSLNNAYVIIRRYSSTMMSLSTILE